MRKIQSHYCHKQICNFQTKPIDPQITNHVKNLQSHTHTHTQKKKRKRKRKKKVETLILIYTIPKAEKRNLPQSDGKRSWV